MVHSEDPPGATATVVMSKLAPSRSQLPSSAGGVKAAAAAAEGPVQSTSPVNQ